MKKNKLLKNAIFAAISIFSINNMVANAVELKSNNTASCDSTCTFEVPLETVKLTANQQFFACPDGYVGNRSQRKYIDDYSVADSGIVDNCICQSKTFTQTLECPTNQRGELVQERNWTCNGNSGSYSPWTTKTNTCKIYPVSFGMEERGVACPSGQVGIIYQNRSYVVNSDNSKSNYTEWTEKGNTCKELPTSTAGSGSNWVSLYKDYYAGRSTGCRVGPNATVGIYSFDTQVNVGADGMPTYRSLSSGLACSGWSCTVRGAVSTVNRRYITFQTDFAGYTATFEDTSGDYNLTYSCRALFN